MGEQKRVRNSKKNQKTFVFLTKKSNKISYIIKQKTLEKAKNQGNPTSFLSNIKRSATSSTFRFKLTPQIIQQIFEEFPSVKEKYNTYVPEIDEATFWKKFFESHYFNRERYGVDLQKNITSDDIFSDCDYSDIKGNSKQFLLFYF